MAAAAAIENHLPVAGESKSAKKKKAKAEAAANGSSSLIAPVIPDAPGNDGSSMDEVKADGEALQEHPFVRELQKQIRNISKKLAGMQKTDSVLAENPGVSLDELVAAKKINNDQKASVLKKPHLKEQLDMLESQVTHYRQFESDFQTRLSKQKEDLGLQHQRALDQVKEEAKVQATTSGAAELRKKLLIFSQFLRCAAHKRTVEEEAETEESRAFEGALLLVYGGDQKAVDTAMCIIEGSDKQVPSIEGFSLPVKYSQIKQASIDHAPFQAEEIWIDQVAEANAASYEATADGIPPGSDPTVTHAGLTELDPQTNGINTQDSIKGVLPSDVTNSSSNQAGERWDPTAADAEKLGLDDSYEIVPRPSDEVEKPVSSADVQEGKRSWADEAPAFEAPATGNLAGEQWDLKAPGDQTDNSWAAEPVAQISTNGVTEGVTGVGTSEDADGFHQVAGRHRGRGGRGRGADGEFRGRGRGRGGFRGDGEFRGRGRGGFRGNRGDGEFRGRGGRGRGAPGGVGEAKAARGSS